MQARGILKRWICFVTLYLILPSPQQALAGIEPKIRGFLSITAEKSNSDIEYALPITDDLTLEANSKVGLHISKQFDDKWNLAVQMLAQSEDSRFSFSLDWGLLAWKPWELVEFRFGKHRVSTWLFSDTLNVGYFFPWIRPPYEVYSTNPINNYIGASATTYQSFGNWRMELEVFAGEAPIDLRISGEDLVGKGRNSIGMALSLSYDVLFKLHIGYSQAQVYFESFSTLRNVVVPGTSSVTTLVTPFDLGTQRSLTFGLENNWKNFLLLGEYARRTGSESLIGDSSAIYGTLGYWFLTDRLLGHATYSTDISDTGSTASGESFSAIFGLTFKLTESVTAKIQVQRSDVRGGIGDFSASLPDAVWFYGLGLDALF